jgi:hypothetical protein
VSPSGGCGPSGGVLQDTSMISGYGLILFRERGEATRFGSEK